jgi:hypothetical protein
MHARLLKGSVFDACNIPPDLKNNLTTNVAEMGLLFPKPTIIWSPFRNDRSSHFLTATMPIFCKRT